jgi:hypothetical protein
MGMSGGNVTSLGSSRRRTAFAAVIGHADEPDLLRRCIAHHLAVGVERVFVSLNLDDPQGLDVVREFADDDRVRGAPPEAFAPDPFHFFTAAIEVVRTWCEPEWVLIVDTDEFWVPRSGHIGDTSGLADADILRVWRYNAPALLDPDGTTRWTGEAATDSMLYAPQPGPARADHAWIRTQIAPKVLTRPEAVREVGRGAHDVVPAIDPVRRAIAHDLVVLHLPITTRQRFERKMRAIRRRLETYGERFTPAQAAHWRRWLEIENQGGLEQEFAAQLLDPCELEPMRRDGRLITPTSLFDAWEQEALAGAS